MKPNVQPVLQPAAASAPLYRSRRNPLPTWNRPFQPPAMAKPSPNPTRPMSSPRHWMTLQVDRIDERKFDEWQRI